MSWFERQIEQIRRAPTPCIIDAREGFGAPYLFQAIASQRENVLWIDVEAGDDAVRLGNHLSDALLRATGATLFGRGMPYQYGLRYLVHLTDELGPLSLLIGGGHAEPEFTRAALRSSVSSDGALRVIAAGHAESTGWTSILEMYEAGLITEDQLTVTEEEAIEMFGEPGPRNGEVIATALRLAGGAYEGVLAGVSSATGGLLPVRPSPNGIPVAAVGRKRDSGYLERLMAAERWQEAFEHAVELESDLALDLVTEAADVYFSNGEVLRFLQFVQRLNRMEPHHGGVMYWLFQAHVSVGRLGSIEDKAARFIERHSAPDLQAAFASAVRPANAFQLAESAVAASKTPETLASFGFFRTIKGDAAGGVRLLKESFEGFKTARRHHKAVQVSNSIGSACVQMGQYRRAMYWAKWSLDELRRRGIREELLRLSSINLLTFTQLLIGEIEAGEEQLRRIDLRVEGPLPSTLEGLISTFGDYHVVKGQPLEGLRYYERLVKHLGSQLPGFAAHNYVRGLVHAGRLNDAEAALDVATDVGGASDDVERDNIALARVLVDVVAGVYRADRFEQLMNTSAIRSDAVMRAELAICHAAFLYSAGASGAARDALLQHSDVLEELGPSGWILLAPPDTDVEKLRGLLGVTRQPSVRLTLLGARSMRGDGTEGTISLRMAELLVVLALHPNGLSGEALLYEMYGEDGVLGTLKAIVSRSRRVIDIASAPYRISRGIECDFIDIDDRLRNGRLREALELYKGPLLPESEAPGVRRARERIDEAVRQAVLHAGEWDLALRLARKFPDDLELWEEAERLAPKNDPAYPLIRARVRRIRGEWGL